MKQVFAGQFFHYRFYSSRKIQILDMMRPAWGKLAQVWNPCAYFVNNVKIKFYAHLVCYRRKMKHGVCRTTECHIDCKSIFKSFWDNYIGRPYIFLNQLHYFYPGKLRKTYSFRKYGRYCAVARKAHS